jgi:hypothetical protein
VRPADGLRILPVFIVVNTPGIYMEREFMKLLNIKGIYFLFYGQVASVGGILVGCS